MISLIRPAALVTGLSLASLVACKPATPPAPPAAPAAAPANQQQPADASHGEDHDHDHAKNGDHDHDHDHKPGSHGGPVVDLGSIDLEGITVAVTRDEGPITAGGDSPIDATITGAEPIAVRFWIGTRDGRGSVKAKAAVEDPHAPNRWHTHVEIPNPMPEGSQLWIEVELEGGARKVGGVDLKAG